VAKRLTNKTVALPFVLSPSAAAPPARPRAGKPSPARGEGTTHERFLGGRPERRQSNRHHQPAAHLALGDIARGRKDVVEADVVVIVASLSRSSSRARWLHASMRAGFGTYTELMPRTETPRRMNGATEVGSSMPAALPHAAMAPSPSSWKGRWQA